MAIQRNDRRAVREKFHKRYKSWSKKGDQLARLTGADIYTVIYHSNKYYTYKSTNRPGWPPSEQDISNFTPPPFRQCPQDFETVNEERDEDKDDEEGEEGGGGKAVGEDRGQAEGLELNGSKESRTQKTSEKIVDQRRVFTIPKPPVLRRSSIEGPSHTDGRKIL